MKDKKKEEQEKLKTEYLFTPLNNVDDLRNWMITYLGIDFPKGVVYPGSTHAPADAMWRIYELIKTGESEKVSEVVILSSRMSYKTLGVAAIETLCMLHFRLSIAHMAAIKSQSSKAIQYINSFFRKLSPYLEENGWKNTSDSKSKIEWITDEDETVYLQVIVASVAGANSEHCPILCVEENSKVITNKGKFTIKKVYEKIKKGEQLKALTFNHFNGIKEYKKITDAHFNGDQKVVKIEINDNFIVCTPDHRILTNNGYKQADKLDIKEDLILCHKDSDNRISKHIDLTLPNIQYKEPENCDQLEQFLIGSLLGDGGVYKRSTSNAYFAETHSLKQKDYAEWKTKVLSNTFKVTFYQTTNAGYKNTPQCRVYTGNTSLLNKWVDFRKTLNGVEKLEALGLAIWYMDDGNRSRVLTFSSHGFTKDQNELLSNLLNKKFGFNTNVFQERKKDGRVFYYIKGNTEDLYKFYKICDKHIHPSMRYKLDYIETIIRTCPVCEKQFFNSRRAGNPTTHCGDPICRSISIKTNYFAKIKNITQMPNEMPVYDLTIEDNHNMVINSNIWVHQCIDEIDCIQDPRALKEAKFIPASYKGYFPLTVYLSTRKYAGGLMEQTVKSVPAAGGEILRWNILDVCERISKDIARINEPKVKRYITRELPMSNISPEEYAKLTEEQQVKYEEFMAYAGIANDNFLPVMRNYLVDRPAEDRDNLYFRLSEVKNNFKKSDPDTANAQLLCNKPSSSGLVYPHFSETENVLTVQQAICRITGQDICEVGTDSFEYLVQYMIDLGIVFVGGGDWGFTNFTSLPVLALIPNGEVWQMDLFIENKLELDDIVLKMGEFMDRYGLKTWYTEQAYPAYIKTMKRVLKDKGIKIPTFVKDVEDGITAVQAKIVDAQNNRKFYILDTPSNKFAITAFGAYMWALDGQGEVIEGKPQHDSDGVTDYMDSLRYIFQCLFSTGGKKPTLDTNSGSNKPKDPKQQQDLKTEADDINKQIMVSVVNKLATNGTGVTQTKGKKKIFWA